MVQSGHTEKCEVVVSNVLTGQIEVVALNIRGSDKMASQLTGFTNVTAWDFHLSLGSESTTFIQLLLSLAHSFSWLFVPLMTLCIAAIILIAGMVSV